MKKLSGLTFVEVIIVVALITVLSTMAYFLYNPAERTAQAARVTAVDELKAIANAVQLYYFEYGTYPPDTHEGVPEELAEFIADTSKWTYGPFPGSKYDYDNWLDRDCVGTDNDYNTIQVTLRLIPDRNPDGSNTWAWYVPIFGPGLAHCHNAVENELGECVVCEDFDIDNPPE